MEFHFAILVLSGLSVNALGKGIHTTEEIAYSDLRELNIACYPKDSCEAREPDDSPGINYPHSCSCHRQCSTLGTCCIDSSFRNDSSPMLKCRTVDFPGSLFSMSSGYYMVDKCLDYTENNSIWKHLCEEEWNKDDDVLKIAPVTSLDSNITYKNYYCLKCHEMSDNFLYWRLNLLGNSMNSAAISDSDFSVRYNHTENTWLATVVNSSISIQVTLKFLVPEGIKFPFIPCDPKVITDCPDSWKDESVRSKCSSYTGLLYRGFNVVYKNAYCVLCNFQTLQEFSCNKAAPPKLKKIFSFAQLIDVNGFLEDKVKKTEKCGNNEIFDPYSKKCRKLVCALPGYVIKDGKCAPP